MKEAKPGYKTTEFWMSLIPQILVVAVAFGWFTADDAEKIGTAAPIVVKTVSTAAVAAVSFVAYIWSRVKIKTAG